MSDQISRLRVIRTLVIEGPTDWVLETLSKSWIAPEGEPCLGLDKRYYEANRMYAHPIPLEVLPVRPLSDTELQSITEDLRTRRTAYQQTRHNPSEA